MQDTEYGHQCEKCWIVKNHDNTALCPSFSSSNVSICLEQQHFATCVKPERPLLFVLPWYEQSGANIKSFYCARRKTEREGAILTN